MILRLLPISRFDKGEGQPPGIYRVEIYVNAEYAFSRDIAFQLRTPSDKPSSDDTGLEPCLPIALLEQLNVNLQSFPSLRDEPASACINVPQSIPDASVRFDFELQRLNISLPQIALKMPGEDIFRRRSGMRASRQRYLITSSRAVIRTAMLAVTAIFSILIAE